VEDPGPSVTELSAAREIAVRSRGHSYRAVLTPALDVGAYTVEGRELPGCITEGDTLRSERMAREAIATWLDAALGWSVAPRVERAIPPHQGRATGPSRFRSRSAR